MKIKLDENLPAELVDVLLRLGHDSDSVPQEGLAGKDDDVVWKASQVAERLFVTRISTSATTAAIVQARITAWCSSV